MPIDLYHSPGSAPCRAVRLVAAALGVELNLKYVDVMGGEHLKPEFLKLNLQHTIPTIVDDGFSLWESRAIITYLINKYGNNNRMDFLYPKEEKARAVVDHRLYFDLAILYQAFATYYYPIIFLGANPNQSKYEKIGVAFDFLDKFLNGRNYVAGDHLTIADISIITNVSNFEVMKYDFDKFKNVSKWYAKVRSEIFEYEEINGEGMKAFQAFVEKYSKK